MPSLAFASRNAKEVLRDPITIITGLGFPLALLVLLSAIQKNVPEAPFNIQTLTPGVAVFGLSFFPLFVSLLVARDRETSFLVRLFTSPLTAADYILGYALPFIPMAILQAIITFSVAIAFGFQISWNTLVALLVMLPAVLLYVGFGLWGGSTMDYKVVGGVMGGLLTNLSAWLSGIWFDVELVGGWFKQIADVLPFIHAVNVTRAASAGDYAAIFPELWWVISYTVAIFGLAIWAFRRQMQG